MCKRRISSSQTVSPVARHFLWVATIAGLTAFAHSQSPSSSAASASTPALQPYTAPDQSAQAGVPPGWKVTKGSQTVISMTGPKGEMISLGQTFVAKNAAFQASAPPANGIDVSIPNSASLAEKFTDLLEFAAAQSHGPAPNAKIGSSTPLKVPAPFQCGSLAGTYTGPNGPLAFGVLICSLPVDIGGAYKIMFKLAQAPPDIAAQEKALAGAVFASYRLPQQWLQKKLAPHFMPPPAPPAGANAGSIAGFNSAMSSLRAVNNSANCFDLGVIREEPNWQLPRSCGGLAPNQ